MSETPPAPEEDGAPAGAGRGPSRFRHLGELPLYLAAATVTCLVTAWALQLWNASRAVPFFYAGDAISGGAHFKTVLETGWYERQPALGAPFGQTYHDFPVADNLHMAVVAVMDLVVDSWAVAFNAYYVLGFPLAALTAVWFFRLVGVSRALSVVLAVLFALAPYHFERNQGHLFLASYYPIPLAAGIVVMALRGSALWGRRSGDRPRVLAWLTGAGAVTVLAMVLVGTASVYYGIFTGILLAVAGVAALWRDRSWPRFTGVAAAGGVLLTTMLVNMAPDLLYARGREPNAIIVSRIPSEAELYGLKLAQLLLPSAHHRWEPLRELRQTYDDTFPLPGERPVLGGIAAAGLVVLLVVVVAAVAGKPSTSQRGTTLRHLSVLTIAALAVAGIGGLSTLVALFVTENVRGWNRMSIFITAFCLAAVGLAVDGLAPRVRAWRPDSRPLRVGVPTALAGILLVVGIADQTSPDYVPDYDGVRELYLSDAAYVREIEEQLPTGAAVYQLPYQAFPESLVNGVLDSDQLRLYLSSTDLRWSGGALKGRPHTDWPARLADEPISTVVPLLAVVGFSGISVDRAALGEAAPQVEAQLRAELGAGPTARSGDERFAFWPLGEVQEEVAARSDPSELEALRKVILLPPVAYPGPRFGLPIDRGGTTAFHSDEPENRILLDNPRADPVAVHLSFQVGSSKRTLGVEVQLPGREPFPLDLTSGPVPVEVDLELPPGRSVVLLRVTSTTPAGNAYPKKPTFDVIGVKLTEPAFERLRP